jgi:malonyl CoA-acyl carrier protein transacylase
MSIICLFPGQGSQKVGMGAELFERFADWTAEADALLGYSIRELCVEDPRGQLVQTAFTQPALFTVNAMLYRARQESGRPAPDFVAGHSLGEYNALVAAGVFDFATGLGLVARRGAIMG